MKTVKETTGRPFFGAPGCLLYCIIKLDKTIQKVVFVEKNSTFS